METTAGAVSLAGWRAKYAPEILGEHESLLQALEQARRIAPFDLPVLITGETGTGKELLAQAIHRASKRSNGPFVAVNCAAIPESLAGSELFGHARGAFTGAECERAGVFEQANRGTLLLDELGAMPEQIQPYLLRALATSEVTPIGGRSIRTNVRIIAATNADIHSARNVRADLYYRLAVWQIHLMPLRLRGRDALTVFQHMVGSLELTGEAMDYIVSHPWPGNLRDLNNAALRALAFSETKIRVEHLCQPRDLFTDAVFQNQPLLPMKKGTLLEIEQEACRQALERANGNKAAAARELGLNRTTLGEKLRKWQWT